MATFSPVAEVEDAPFVPVGEAEETKQFIPVEEAPDLGDFMRQPEATVSAASPVTSGAMPQVRQGMESPLPRTEKEAIAAQVPPGDVPGEIGGQTAALPRFGKEGTLARSFSDVISGMGEWALNRPEEALATLTPLGPAIAARYAPEMAQQWGENLLKGLKGDRKALNDAIAMATVIGLPIGAKKAFDAWKVNGPSRVAPELPKDVANAESLPKPASLLPRSAAAVERQTTGETNARPLEEAATDDGNLLSSSRESAGQVPVAEGQPRVLPEAQGGLPEEAIAAEQPNTKEVITNETQNQEKGNEEVATLPPEPAAEGGAEASAAQPAPAPSAPVEADGAAPEMSVGPGAASPEDVPPSTGGEDVTGVAQRVREKMAAAGQEAIPPRGEGVSAQDSVEHGRELLSAGANPETAMAQFEQTQRVSADDFALARAHSENLAFAMRRTEERFGTDSPEWRSAKEARDTWAARTKKMGTEWHKIGQAQQGEVDIDTGDFSALRNAYQDATGKDFTEGQTTTAKKKAKASKAADDQEGAAKDKLFTHIKDRAKQIDADKAALDAANKAVIYGATKLAELERKQQVLEAQRQLEISKIKQAAEEKIKAITDKVARRNAIKAAQDEVKAANDRAKAAKDAAELQRKVEQNALDAANKVVRDNAVRRAREGANELEMTLAEKAWVKARDYIDNGMDNFDDIRTKLATDLGVPVKDVVAALGKDKRAKFLADDLWKKQQVARSIRQQSKQWLKDTAIPGYQRAIRSIPRAMFGLKVGFHGTVALGTHAPMVAFQPRFWKTYVQNFGKMYRMVKSPAYYEMQVQDLVRKPNYTTARRAGLVNDPAVYEDFNSPDTTKYFGNLTGMGNRGYSVLKMLRQDMFDQMWDKLPRTAQIPEMAEAISDGLNHATGVVKGKAPAGTNIGLFAPRLEASRVMWLAGDPIRAANTFLQWSKADMAERAFALNQIKEKAWVAGTMLSALALNQGFLSATGSKQAINVDDPFRSDFLKFKAAGMDLSYGNAMLSMARLPVRLYKIRSSDGGKLKNLVYPDEDTYSVLGQYARSQLSPFASLATTLWLKADFQNRPLPNSSRPIPKRLRAQGIQPYTWPEFWTEQVLPIPAEEAVREVWRSGLGMSEEQVQSGLKALATIAVMGATGARLTDDISLTHRNKATVNP